MGGWEKLGVGPEEGEQRMARGGENSVDGGSREWSGWNRQYGNVWLGVSGHGGGLWLS